MLVKTIVKMVIKNKDQLIFFYETIKSLKVRLKSYLNQKHIQETLLTGPSNAIKNLNEVQVLITEYNFILFKLKYFK